MGGSIILQSKRRATTATLVITLTLIAPAVVATGLADPFRNDTDPARVGRWDPVVIEGEVPAVSMSLLADGRVLYWSGVEVAGEHDDDFTFFLSHPHEADSRVLDLSGPAPVVVTPGNSNGGASDLFCAGHVLLPDGRVLAAGGTDWTTIGDAGAWDILYGTRDARYFDPVDTAWKPAPDMAHGRWYPSVITLQDGDALVASGIETLTDQTTLQTAIERFDPEAESWSHAGDRLLPMYPRLEVMPSGPLKGQVLYSTVGTLWGPFGAHPAEAPWSLQHAFDPETGSWDALGPSVFGVRQHASSVLLPLDAADDYRAEVLTFGGTLQRSVAATPLAEVADLSTSPPTNRPVAPLHEARWHANGVLLPDGTVLAVGGGKYDNVVAHGQPNVPVMAAEQYDPVTGSWTRLSEMQVPRMYHSTALLLPDGRVLAGGHVPLPVPFKDARDNVDAYEQTVETRLEIFEPPYLHRGERPVIHAAPERVHHDADFEVTVSHADAIEDVVLVRPGATTHAYDSSQRVINLDFEALTVGAEGDGVLRVSAPPDGNVAPPGSYMLFVNRGTAEGPVPSVAAWVQVGA